MKLKNIPEITKITSENGEEGGNDPVMTDSMLQFLMELDVIDDNTEIVARYKMSKEKQRKDGPVSSLIPMKEPRSDISKDTAFNLYFGDKGGSNESATRIHSDTELNPARTSKELETVRREPTGRKTTFYQPSFKEKNSDTRK